MTRESIPFRVYGVDVEKVEVVDDKGCTADVTHTHKLPEGFGSPKQLRIHPVRKEEKQP